MDVLDWIYKTEVPHNKKSLTLATLLITDPKKMNLTVPVSQLEVTFLITLETPLHTQLLWRLSNATGTLYYQHLVLSIVLLIFLICTFVHHCLTHNMFDSNINLSPKKSLTTITSTTKSLMDMSIHESRKPGTDCLNLAASHMMILSTISKNMDMSKPTQLAFSATSLVISHLLLLSMTLV